jgi:hypothetical protein
MYAKRVNTKVPRENEPTGFDLMAGDWVSPFGAGKNTDLFLKVERHVVSDREYDARLEISFPNEGDGIVALPPVPDTGSELLMPPTASAEAYAPTRVWRQARTPSGPAAGPEPVLGYFFRTRTILTEKAEIKSALYGKIMGDIDFYVGTRAPKSGIGFTYYLNPTPNDRNVEFDPKQNLLPASKRAEERVKRP